MFSIKGLLGITSACPSSAETHQGKPEDRSGAGTYPNNVSQRSTVFSTKAGSSIQFKLRKLFSLKENSLEKTPPTLPEIDLGIRFNDNDSLLKEMKLSPLLPELQLGKPFNRNASVENGLHKIADKCSKTEIQQRNLLAAQNALQMIREEIYKPRLKSGNKLRGKIEIEFELKRINKSDEFVNSGRSITKNMDAMEQGEYQFKERAHQCGDLSRAAQLFFVQCYGLNSEVYGTGSHAFAIVGDHEDKNLPANMCEWPEHIGICDPWANIACLARDYPSEFSKKMEKWEKDGKRVRIPVNDEFRAKDWEPVHEASKWLKPKVETNENKNRIRIQNTNTVPFEYVLPTDSRWVNSVLDDPKSLR